MAYECDRIPYDISMLRIAVNAALQRAAFLLVTASTEWSMLDTNLEIRMAAHKDGLRHLSGSRHPTAFGRPHDSDGTRDGKLVDHSHPQWVNVHAHMTDWQKILIVRSAEKSKFEFKGACCPDSHILIWRLGYTRGRGRSPRNVARLNY